ncbi:hypothetical protein B0H14DRAFT_2602209 [Mycena olivaceomarginata]|nr:hypothetical protein B0H14DRAFT_2602209 [Mycena olivaceomarginata]
MATTLEYFRLKFDQYLALFRARASRRARDRWGLRDGKQEGRKVGKPQGLKEGEVIGFEKGRADGLSEGKRLGFVAGREFGEKQAVKLSKTLTSDRVFVDVGTDPPLAELALPPPPSPNPVHAATQTDRAIDTVIQTAAAILPVAVTPWTSACVKTIPNMNVLTTNCIALSVDEPNETKAH